MNSTCYIHGFVTCPLNSIVCRPMVLYPRWRVCRQSLLSQNWIEISCCETSSTLTLDSVFISWPTWNKQFKSGPGLKTTLASTFWTSLPSTGPWITKLYQSCSYTSHVPPLLSLSITSSLAQTFISCLDYRRWLWPERASLHSSCILKPVCVCNHSRSEPCEMKP